MSSHQSSQYSSPPDSPSFGGVGEAVRDEIVVIRYNAGNIQSVLFALERLGVKAFVTDDIAAIKKAEKVIFPGVGAANSAMPYLKEKGLDKVIRSLEQPFLGICLGMQLMCNHSEEGNTECLGIFDLPIKKFTQGKVPHVGWNNLAIQPSELLTCLPEHPYCYFVHSYYAVLGENTIATTEYGLSYSSILQKDNFYGVQFHPEKSAAVGQQILRNFLRL